MVDGLKPGQRKILYACFKRNLRKDIKVAQLAGYVAEHSGGGAVGGRGMVWGLLRTLRGSGMHALPVRALGPKPLS